MKRPQLRVSVLLATCSRPQFVGGAIKSVLEQKFQDFEILVISDGDQDETRLAVKPFLSSDSRIRYLGIPQNGRIASVANIGLAQARGEYIAILDDDDRWADPFKTGKQVKFLDEHPEYVGCGGGYTSIDANGCKTGLFIKPERDEEIRRNMLVANPMANSSTMYRRRAAEAIGGYDEKLEECADWDFWLRIGLSGRLYNFPENFLYYRIWAQGISFIRQRATARSALHIVFKHQGQYPRFVSALCSALAFRAYTALPQRIRNNLNGRLSHLKKSVFANKIIWR